MLSEYVFLSLLAVVLAVLILVLVEHALGDKLLLHLHRGKIVLILVLVEHALGGLPRENVC